ncbi:type II toxin-antitoxin system RelE/ParE family toxin [Dyadobacter sp.]|uniref:type II toxin-antitoxin system RelE/ParE family toxin n=1 Tax=Dyadobacter sp. TaxID=1914288 RepID=UPI003F72C471
MAKVREVSAYRHYFEEFLHAQTLKVQNKIFKIIEAVETLQRVPSSYLKSIQNTNGLYEIRIKLGSDIWRVFCFFENDRLVILLTGFQKQSQKTPRSEISRAVKLMEEYREAKRISNGNKKLG